MNPDGVPHPGAGPVYLSGWSAHLELARWPDGWLGTKWVVTVEGEPASAPVLVRGDRIDGEGDVLFTGEPPSDAASADVVLGPNRVINTHFMEAGCYGVQVDTASGSHILVVEVLDEALPSPGPPSTRFANPSGAPLTVRLFSSYQSPVIVSDADVSADPATVDDALYWRGQLSPQGLAVTTDRLRELRITPATGTRRCVTDNVVFDGFPAWSPDGATILFKSTRGGRRGVWVMDAEGGNQHQLAATEHGTDWYASWSPGGTRIVFCSDRDGGWHIYTMAADGSHVRQVTDGGGSD